MCAEVPPEFPLRHLLGEDVLPFLSLFEDKLQGSTVGRILNPEA